MKRFLSLCILATISLIALSACNGEDVQERCLRLSVIEHRELREATLGLISKSDIISVADENGCDSANDAAWVLVDIKRPANPESVLYPFLRNGWTRAKVDQATCPECLAILQKNINDRLADVILAEVDKYMLQLEITYHEPIY